MSVQNHLPLASLAAVGIAVPSDVHVASASSVACGLLLLSLVRSVRRERAAVAAGD